VGRAGPAAIGWLGSFLLKFSMLLCWWGCGWVERETRGSCAWACPSWGACGVWGFGTLLGPEETPAGWVGFSWLAVSRPGPSNASPYPWLALLGFVVWGGGVVVVVVGGGVVVC
jgi:hypothetical protein